MALDDSGIFEDRTLIEVESNHLLLVEGRDEFFVFTEILHRMDVDDIQLIDVEGITRFGSRLRALRMNAESNEVQLASIGLVRDADNDATAAFQSLSDALRSNDLPVPVAPGQVTDDRNDVVTGILILPDNQSPGALEDLCMQSIDSQNVHECIARYISCMRECGEMHSRIPSKTRAHVYLATRENPVVNVGVGARRDYWDFESPAFNIIREFIESISV